MSASDTAGKQLSGEPYTATGGEYEANEASNCSGRGATNWSERWRSV